MLNPLRLGGFQFHSRFERTALGALPELMTKTAKPGAAALTRRLIRGVPPALRQFHSTKKMVLNIFLKPITIRTSSAQARHWGYRYASHQ
jgi:hypothetical protein